MTIPSGSVFLRDIRWSDLALREYWEFQETEWKQWDAPWIYEPLGRNERLRDSQTFLQGLRQRLTRETGQALSEFRLGFEIARTSDHCVVGWVSAYFITANYEWTPTARAAHGIAVGLVIAAPQDRARGYGVAAVYSYLNYLRGQSYSEAYTQTWSGNLPMIHLAKKLGFVEVERKTGQRMIQGKAYDGLTFRIDLTQTMEIADH